MKAFNSIIILGPTASGKTRLAAHLAFALKGAVLSFDSRQVYKNLNIGTGKDLDEFIVEGKNIAHYLIDICDVNTNFHSFEFVKNYIHAFDDCELKNLLPILCGGTGLYFDLALKKHQYINIPNNEKIRKEQEGLTDESLLGILSNYPLEFRYKADTTTRKRVIRAIEIAEYLSHNTHQKIIYPDLKPLLFGISLPVTERKTNIENRLKLRLENGLIEEVENLLQSGIPPERLIYLGLEYKYITEFLTGKYRKETMVQLLQTAIIQYAKRQMTWFRKMEREGNLIHWIDGHWPVQEQINFVLKIINE